MKTPKKPARKKPARKKPARKKLVIPRRLALTGVCLLPSFAKRALEAGTYSPWFIAHADHLKLIDEEIQSLLDAWLKENQERPVLFPDFMEWLDGRKGYRVLSTGDPWRVVVQV